MILPPYPTFVAPSRGGSPSRPPTGLGSSRSDLDRFRLREVVESVKDVTKLDPHAKFVELFKATLDFRQNEDVFSRVRAIALSPGPSQRFKCYVEEKLGGPEGRS
jgi:hypothetical protein